MLDPRARQLRDEQKSGGTQSANISMIYRRTIGPAPTHALEEKQHQNQENLGKGRFSSIDSVSHISRVLKNPSMGVFSDGFSGTAPKRVDPSGTALGRVSPAADVTSATWEAAGDPNFAITAASLPLEARCSWS